MAQVQEIAWHKSRKFGNEHLNLTAREAIAEIGGEYDRSVELYDLIHAQILQMSDMLAEGISHQFP